MILCVCVCVCVCVSLFCVLCKNIIQIHVYIHFYTHILLIAVCNLSRDHLQYGESSSVGTVSSAEKIDGSKSVCG